MIATATDKHESTYRLESKMAKVQNSDTFVAVPPTFVYASWKEYFENRVGTGWGVNLDTLSQTYCDDAPVLIDVLTQYWDTGVLMVPTSGNGLRALHHCSLDLERGRVVGAAGFRRYPPYKEVTVKGLIKPFVIPEDQLGDSVPTIDDFLDWDIEKPLSSVVGSGEEELLVLKCCSSSFWVRPDVYLRFYSQQQSAVEAAVLLHESVENPDSLGPEEVVEVGEALRFQLLFLWAMVKGYIPNTQTYDAADTEVTQRAIEKANDRLFTGGAPGSDNEPDNQPEQGVRGGRCTRRNSNREHG